MVLDEATAHLDAASEEKVQAALHRVLVGRTSVVIAHRLSTIRDADEIAVIDGGRVVERGTHEDLVARDGLYAHLNRTQFGRSEQSNGRSPVVADEPITDTPTLFVGGVEPVA